jgi:hypothetical protein
VVAVPPEPPAGARSTAASATVAPPEDVVSPPLLAPPPRLDDVETVPPVIWPALLAPSPELEEVIPPEDCVEEKVVLLVPPIWPPVLMELAKVAPPVDAIPPVPELPPSAAVPPADPSWFTLGALLLHARPSRHAKTTGRPFVFIGYLRAPTTTSVACAPPVPFTASASKRT